MNKRILSIILVLCVVLSFIPLTAFADNVNSSPAAKRYTVLLLDTARERKMYPDGLGGPCITVGASLDKVKQASSKFIEQVLSASGENYVAIVSFDSTATIKSGFSNDYATLNTTINGLQSGSPWIDSNQALILADELLGNISDENAIKNILYFSGGLPSEGSYSTSGYYSEQDYGWYRSDNHNYMYAYCNPAYATSLLLKEKGYTLYTLGCFTNLSEQPESYNFTIHFMKDIQNGGFYDAENPNDLEFVFGEIAEDIINKRTGTFYFQSKNKTEKDYVATYFYDDNYFSEDASIYNPSLATMSLCFELSAGGSNVGGKSDYSNKSRNAQDMLGQIGFKNFETNDHFKDKPKEDTMGVVVAHKDIKVNDNTYTLIALATRGGGYEAEWAGNFTIGASGQHEGFKKATAEAYRFLSDYITRHKGEFKKDIKFWFAGYSRAGATVNMLAGRLDDERQIAGISFEKKDLYAYCFEPPKGVLKSQTIPVENYTNIHNIVNPNDLVTRVAPRAWGFARYGIDESVIPTNVTYSDPKVFDDMFKIFQSLGTQWVHESIVEVDGQEQHIVNTFQAKKFDPGVKIEGHWEERTGWFGVKYWLWIPNFKAQLVSNDNMPMSLAVGQLVSSFAAGIGGRQNYTEKLQQMARLAVAEYLGEGYESYKWGKAFDIFDQKLKEHVLDIAGAFLESGESGVENLVMEYLYKSILEAQIDLKAYESIPNGFVEALNVLVRTAVESLCLYGGDQFATWICDDNYKKLLPAHYPELCLAWLQAQDKNYDPGGRELFVINSYRIVRVNCPVDVSVYNSKGTLVAQIIKDVPQKIDGSTIFASFNTDGEKVVYLPADEDYDIRIVATGDGKLDYSVSEFSYDTDSYAKIVNYYDIPIVAGDKLSGVVPKFLSEDTTNTGEGSKAKYALSDSKGELTPSKELLGKSAQDAVYSVYAESNNTDGGTTIGGGVYSEGAFARVVAKAYEKCEFTGWYENDVLVSTEAAYRFQVKKDISLTAKFNGKRPNPTSGTYPLVIKAGTGGSITTGANGNYSDGSNTPLEATPNSNYRFKNWTSSNGGTFANTNSASTIFTMPANATTLTANFEYVGGTPSSVPIPVSQSTVTTSSSTTSTTTIMPTPTATVTPIPSHKATEQVPSPKPGVPKFKDVNGHWAEEYIEKLYSRGIISGYDDLTIRPDNDITRAEMSIILAKALDLDISNDASLDFNDIQSIPDWAVRYVGVLNKNGVIKGYDDRSFRANNKLTRAELITMAMRAFNCEISNIDVGKFSDAKTIPPWAIGFISVGVKEGILNGYNDGTFKPLNNIKRAEAFKVISICLEKYEPLY